MRAGCQLHTAEAGFCFLNLVPLTISRRRLEVESDIGSEVTELLPLMPEEFSLADWVPHSGLLLP